MPQSARDHGLAYVTTGIPSGQLGTTGDVAIDPATGIIYTKDAVNGWGATFTPSSSSSPTFTNVTDSSLTQNGFMFPGAGGLLSSTAAATNGQLLIGKTGNAPVPGNITGNASGIVVTNGAGTIALALANALAIPGTIASVNGISTVGNGIAFEVQKMDFINQAVAIPLTTLYAVPAGQGGRYRVTMTTTLTQPATTSSTLPNTTVTWTDADSNGTPSANIGATSTGNNTNSASVGFITVYAKGGTNIQIQSQGWASSGATGMQFAARYQVDYLGA